MIKPVTYQGVFNFKSNLYALEVKSRFIDQSKANGYYSGYGNELAATIVDNQIQIGTGAFVIQGRMNEVESTESVSVTIENGKVGYVVARIETYHPSDEENCTFIVKTAATLDSITLTQEDTYAKGAETSNKVYELPIYSFEMSDGNIVNLTKLIKAVADYNTVKTLADDAVAKATTAINTANSAVSTANSATETANSASDNATEAVGTANSAKITAENAETVANEAKGIAESANTSAINAVNTANSAKSTAENAESTANTAISTANSATDTAKNADSNATDAVKTANTALTNSTEAVGTANSAKTTAENAETVANEAKTKADEAITTVTEKQGTAITVNSTAVTSLAFSGKVDDDTITIIFDGGNA